MRLPADLLLAGENDLPLRIAPLHPGVPHWQISLSASPEVLQGRQAQTAGGDQRDTRHSQSIARCTAKEVLVRHRLINTIQSRSKLPVAHSAAAPDYNLRDDLFVFDGIILKR